MRLTESSIYCGLRKLRDKLYQAQFLMDKGARSIYGRALMEASGMTIRHFTLAFTVKDEKLKHLDEAMGWYAVLRVDIDFCIEQNIIHYAKRKPKPGETVSTESYVSNQKVELYEIIGRIDDEMCRWRASLAKGKTILE